MRCETGIRFELTDGPSQESQRRRQGQECNTKLQKPVMEGTMNVSNRTEQWFVIFSTFPSERLFKQLQIVTVGDDVISTTVQTNNRF